MPAWINWVSLGLALLGALLGVINTVTNHKRGAIRLRLKPTIERGKDGLLSLTVEVENTGRIPVAVKDVVLAEHRGKSSPLYELWTDQHSWNGPQILGPGKAVTFGPISRHALNSVLVQQPLWVLAKAQEDMRVHARCSGLIELYAQLKPAARG